MTPFPGVLASWRLGVSLVAIGDAAAGQIVRREVDGDTIALQDANVVLAHFPADVRQHFMSIFELYAESRIR